MGERPRHYAKLHLYQTRWGRRKCSLVKVEAGYISYLPFTNNHLPSLFMRRAIYPGSFDPVTNGHLDIIQRGCKLFDEIIVAVLINPEKTAFFSVEERCDILRSVLKEIGRGDCTLTVESFEGLLVQYAADRK